MMFDWRTWIYQRLIADAPFALLLPQSSVLGAGGMTAVPKVKPFLVIKMEPEIPGPFPGVARGRTSLWAHDTPGDYLRLDAVLSAARTALCGPGVALGRVAQVGAVGIQWMGDSADLSDPDFGTIIRTSEFDLLGKG